MYKHARAILRYMPAFVLHIVCACPGGASECTGRTDRQPNKGVKIDRRGEGWKMYGRSISHIIGETSWGTVLLEASSCDFARDGRECSRKGNAFDGGDNLVYTRSCCYRAKSHHCDDLFWRNSVVILGFLHCSHALCSKSRLFQKNERDTKKQ